MPVLDDFIASGLAAPFPELPDPGVDHAALDAAFRELIGFTGRAL